MPLLPSESQQMVAAADDHQKIFLEGEVGTGKTTAATLRMINLLNKGVAPESILILVPQRALAHPYYLALNQDSHFSGGITDILTLGGLAQRMTSLFWPLVAEEAGFQHPDRAPVFLTLETAQYYLAHITDPLFENGFFDSITMDRNRIYSQILDNLNKAASIGFNYLETSDRLKNAWVGDSSQYRIYDEAQECAHLFRQYCYQNNLLDFSLQLEIFSRYLWSDPICHAYLQQKYQHLISDNIEEDVPVCHDIIQSWLPELKSAILIYNLEGGYRVFLSADPHSAYNLKKECSITFSLEESFIAPPEIILLRNAIKESLTHQPLSTFPDSVYHSLNNIAYHAYVPEMAHWVSQKIAELIQIDNISPGEIAVLTPFLSDSLRFTLQSALDNFNIPVHTHRPSRSLGAEPITRCLLTMAKLAYPDWNVTCTQKDLRNALVQIIDGLDYVRADLLASIVYHPKSKANSNLSSFDNIVPSMQERISYSIGERYEILKNWIENHTFRQNTPEETCLELDVFISKFFGEVLSQKGWGFHHNFDAASITARLIDSIQKFRWATFNTNAYEMGLDYIQMVEAGVIAAQFLPSWNNNSEKAVMLTPAYTYLMSNRAVSYQFWLDIGSLGWWERLYQPLTHPYVLSRHWQAANKWSDALEFEANQLALQRLIHGLASRCKKEIFFCVAGINEQGYEQRGPLLQATQHLLRGFIAQRDLNGKL